MNICYQDDDVTARVETPGSTLLEVSIANKIPHFRTCGAQGRCTTCRVRILDGLQQVSPRTAHEERIARERKWDPYVRLACQTRAYGDVSLRRLIRSAADISLLQAETLRVDPGREVPVAVLVCDIRGFTPFVEDNLPYDVFHILNRFFGELGEPILLNDGFIYQYVGDQVIGLFGLGGASEAQSCLAAVRAGLGMIAALERLNEQIQAEFGIELGIRLGAHFGTLVVGYMGHPTRLEFSVVGDAINAASRIESANKELGTTFLVSGVLRDRLEVRLREGRRAPVELRGKREPCALIEVLGFEEPDVDLVVQNTARLLLDDQDRFASAFYRRLFEAAPAVRPMFKGDMHSQGRMLMHVLQAAVYGMSRFEDQLTGLAALGRSHQASYGVTDAHYVVFLDVFLETVAEVLGDAFDEEIRHAWAVVLGRISTAMRAGVRKADPGEKVEVRSAKFEGAPA